jgi:Phosphoribosyl transferase domain
MFPCGRIASFPLLGFPAHSVNVFAAPEQTPKQLDSIRWRTGICNRGLGFWNIWLKFFRDLSDAALPAFEEFCASQQGTRAIERLPFERRDGECKKWSYLKNMTSNQLQAVGEWATIVSSVVALRDFLRVSFALDYTRQGGGPEQELTEIAKLRQTAKLYGDSDDPSTTTRAAALALADQCIKFTQESKSYFSVNAVVSVPRSDPSKIYSLPGIIADRISHDLGIEDLSDSIKTLQRRREMKDTPAAERLQELMGTIGVDRAAVKGKRILIVDDLYQSGTTMNYVGMLLLEAGAACVYGLSCEKTCSNQD